MQGSWIPSPVGWPSPPSFLFLLAHAGTLRTVPRTRSGSRSGRTDYTRYEGLWAQERRLVFCVTQAGHIHTGGRQLHTGQASGLREGDFGYNLTHTRRIRRTRELGPAGADRKAKEGRDRGLRILFGWVRPTSHLLFFSLTSYGKRTHLADRPNFALLLPDLRRRGGRGGKGRKEFPRRKRSWESGRSARWDLPIVTG